MLRDGQLKYGLPGSDILVMGGGPAGLASAIAFAQKGYRVCVGDCAVPPIDKACGEGLLPGSLTALRKLGVAIPPAHGARFRGIRFQEGQCGFEASFPNGTGIGVSRPVLQKLLIERAEQLGIELHWGVRGLEWQDGRLMQAGAPVHTGFVVAADGHNSRIRRAAGLDHGGHHLQRFGFRRRYAMTPWSEYAEVYWGQGYQIYVTPVSESEVCVVLMSRWQKLRLDEALRGIPEIAERLAGQKFSSHETGTLTIRRRLKKVWCKGVALAGDASGSVDAITGEGMCLAFKGALALADAYVAGNLTTYQRMHEKFFERPRVMSALLVALGEYPMIRRRVFAGFMRRPDVFGKLLAIHVGMSSVFDFKPSQLLGFGKEFLSA